VAFFNAKSSQGGPGDTLLRVQGVPSTHLLSPWERFERLVVCSNYGGMQITKR
jgi:hypothetical protein